MTKTAPDRAWDTIVIGGGSTGCLLAARLIERLPAHDVLVLEAGDAAEDHPETLRADGYKEAFVNEALMWPRHSVPQPGCNGRAIDLASGRGVGGSASVNAMVYTRGAAADYAQWDLPGWTWADVAPDFAALEAALGLDRHPPSEWGEASIAAAEAAGFRGLDDLNAGNLSGVLGYEQMNMALGANARHSSYAALLRPHLDSDRLALATGAAVQRVTFDAERRARGVEWLDRRGQSHTARLAPGGEVVLCAGALETPRLLMLSGVGAAHHLHAHGVAVVADQPNVGRHLQDHPNVSVFCHGPRDVDAVVPQVYGFHRANPHTRHLAPGQSDTCYVFYPARSSFREGMMRMLPAMTLPPELPAREALASVMRGAVDRAFRLGRVQDFVRRMWGIVVVLGKPQSRGTVQLASGDPNTPARIDPAYFSHPDDMRTMVRGVRLAREIATRHPLQPWYSRELLPGSRSRSDDAIAAFVRRNSMTTYHYTSTARLGTNPADSVLDLDFRVRGVSGLRVADASAIPIGPVSAMNAPSMLIAWRAAAAMVADRVR